jgi:hypothetical protein
LLDDGGDGAWLEAREAGEIGPGHGLLGSDEFKYDVAVNVACDLT